MNGRFEHGLALLGKSILFCALLVAGLAMVAFVLTPGAGTVQPWAAMATAAGEADVIVLGSSHVHCTVMPMELWRRRGITAMDVSSQSLSMPATMAFLSETFTAQKPKIIMLEVHMIGRGYTFDRIAAHSALDHMPPGQPRLQAILTSRPPHDWFELLFPLQLYHSRWPSLTAQDFAANKMTRFDFARGATYLASFRPVGDSVAHDPVPLGSYRSDLVYVRRIAQIAKANDAKLVLFAAPTRRLDVVDGLPILERLRSDLGTAYPDIRYLDLQPVAELAGVKTYSDYKDISHLNFRGAVKISDWLAGYLAGQLGVHDRGGSTKLAARWNESLRKYDSWFVPF